MSTTFNFPANPTLNQQVILPNGSIAQWNGTEWVSVGDSTVTYPLPVLSGGTGASDAAGARINLGLNTATGEFVVQKDGTVAAPGLAFASEPGLGWYRSSAGVVSWASSGSRILSVDGSNPISTSVGVWPRTAGSSSLSLFSGPSAAPDKTLGFAVDTGGSTLTYYTTAGVRRQRMRMDESNFGVDRYDNAGTFIDTPINVTRSDGKVGFTGAAGVQIYDPTASGGSAKLNMVTPGGGKLLRVNSANSFEIIDSSGVNALLALLNTGSLSCRGQMTIGSGRLNVTAAGGVSGVTFNGNDGTTYVGGFDAYPSDGQIQVKYGFGTKTAVFEGGGNFTLINGKGWQAGGGVWGDTSDARVKHDIRDYGAGLDEVLSLRPRVFKFKPETGRDQVDYVGLIYQETDAMPELHTSGPTKLGELEYDDMGSLNASALTYALVNAIKTLDQRLKSIGA